MRAAALRAVVRPYAVVRLPAGHGGRERHGVPGTEAWCGVPAAVSHFPWIRSQAPSAMAPTRAKPALKNGAYCGIANAVSRGVFNTGTRATAAVHPSHRTSSAVGDTEQHHLGHDQEKLELHEERPVHRTDTGGVVAGQKHGQVGDHPAPALEGGGFRPRRHHQRCEQDAGLVGGEGTGQSGHGGSADRTAAYAQADDETADEEETFDPEHPYWATPCAAGKIMAVSCPHDRASAT